MNITQTAHYQQLVSVQNTQKGQAVTQDRQDTSAPAKTDHVIFSSELVTGMELVKLWGSMALGGNEQLEDWASKGLDISEELLQEAFSVFNEAFAAQINRSSVPSSFSFNAHQIVANFQPVPQWFINEQEAALAKILDVEMKEAFHSGSTYFIHDLADTHHKAIATYEQVGAK